MTTHTNRMKTIPILLASLLLCAFALNASAQEDFGVWFKEPTNAVAANVKAYNLLVSTNGVTGWTYNGFCFVGTNQINFISDRLPSNPCWFTVVSESGTNRSTYAKVLFFDRTAWTNPPPAIDPVTTLPVITEIGIKKL